MTPHHREIADLHFAIRQQRDAEFAAIQRRAKRAAQIDRIGAWLAGALLAAGVILLIGAIAGYAMGEVAAMPRHIEGVE